MSPWRVAAALFLAGVAGTGWTAGCDKPVYLTLDTGHMGVAPLVAEVLQRQQVKVTFFIADEKTLDGGSSLDAHWAPWWKARASEGHAFGSHTLDHVYWRRDLPGGRFEMRPSAGPEAGRSREMDGAAYCAELDRSARRLVEMTGQRMAPLFRAPGAGPRRRCWPPRRPAAGGTSAGRRPDFSATSCPATSTPTRRCCSARCVTSAPATS